MTQQKDVVFLILFQGPREKINDRFDYEAILFAISQSI